MAGTTRPPVRGPVRSVSRGSGRAPAHRAARPRRNRKLRAWIIAGVAVAGVLLWAILDRSLSPSTNTSRQIFDAIVVLGTPADDDGNPTPELLERVTEGVREYQRGVAPMLIMTGGPAHNRFIEAEVMAKVAQAQGVPAAQIIQESQARDTIQNACYSARIAKAHGWGSVEVVSAPSHLPRAAIIFGQLPLEWRMHAVSSPLTSRAYNNAAEVVEVIKTARYLVWSRWAESCKL